MSKKLEITVSDEQAEALRVRMLAASEEAKAARDRLAARVAVLQTELATAQASLAAAEKSAKEAREAYDSAWPAPKAALIDRIEKGEG